MPQIEVTFDIDANGIVHVHAKDLGTGKEQSMTITGGSALPKDDIERMMRDAEEHADEDKQRREEAETRNLAESLQWQTEKFLAENGDKLPADAKDRAQRGAGRAAQRARRLRHRGDQGRAGEGGPRVPGGRRRAVRSSRPRRRRGRPRRRAAATAATVGRPAAPADDVVDAEIVDDEDTDKR